MYNINFNKEDNLLLVDVSGEISNTEMIEFVRDLESYSKFTNKLYILQDSREMITKLDIFDIPVIAEEFEKIVSNYQFIKHADIHHLPASTAYALIYQYNTRFPNYKYEIFNTSQSAASWLIEYKKNQPARNIDSKNVRQKDF